IGGEALSKLNLDTFSFNKKLEIFLKTLEGLSEIHKYDLVHRDIKIQNIVFNEKTEDLQIIDFGSASRLTKQNTFVSLHSSIEGTLAYISPEQTGRMNRRVDYRTDFYSLGVTFYQLFTGNVPFIFSDPLELIHAHIAKSPIPPFEKNGTPKVISNIIMKLMKKDPEDRYQSVEGVIYDLEQCKKYLDEKGFEGLKAFEFKIGENDFSGRFQIPEKLYGRENELNQILNQFKEVAIGKTSLILVSGKSGIGKTALVNEIKKPITEYRGYFVSGKFDLLKRSIPYRAISQSFQNLFQQILTESEISIQRWRSSLLNSLGNNAKLITDIIPELETLLGEQPAVVPLPAEESQNRFNEVFQNFLNTLCKSDHPLVIFLDDLQWADAPSLQLIERILLSTDIKNLLIILSYRDNEIFQGDPFSLMIENFKKVQYAYHEIFLEPLTTLDIKNLVKDTLGCNEKDSLEIAKVLLSKTKGNPFFVNAVFKEYHEKGLIRFENREWKIDINRIEQEKIAENVIDFMIDKVKDLPSDHLEILKFAACVGNWFKLDVFKHILNKPNYDVKGALIHLSNEGYLKQNESEVNFVHDKIREAAYSLVSEELRSLNHYNIANGYISLLDRYKLEDHIFTIVNQLNQGLIHLKTEAEIQRQIEYNIIAGKKAISSNAHEAAAGFLNMATHNLSLTSWENNYDQTLDLYSNLAKAEYLNKNYEDAEKVFNTILAKAKYARDKVIVYDLKSSLYVSQNRMVDALDLLKKAVKTLGIRLPAKPSEISPLPEIIKFKIRFGKKSVADLYDALLLNDVNSQLVLHLLNSAIPPSFIGQPALFPVIVLKMVNLSIRKGNSPLGAFSFALFGVIQGSGLGDFETGYQFANLALRLLSKFKDEAKSVECKTRFVCATMVSHWNRHAKEQEPEFLNSIASGRETGDLQYTSYAINNMHFQKLLMRQNLNEVKDSFEKYDKLFQNLKQYNAYQLFQLNKQFIENLTQPIGDILTLKGNYFNEEEVLTEWINSSNVNALFDYYLTKSRLEYLFGDKNKALEYSYLADPFETAMLGMMFVPEHIYFNSIIIASLYPEAEQKQKKIFKKRILKNLKRL
ncbi:MAG: serine/threonine-protein kinase PknK, partial [Leptospira sp.]|nr:serine/threonine-protein kinase PknK [Leptospira sp.]